MKIKITRNKGRGVFATKQYKSGAIIEECPVLVLDKKDTKIIDDTTLYNYYFSWGEKDDSSAIALGYGSLYNHSYSPNAEYIKIIDKDEEICVNYNGIPNNNSKLWFKAS